MRWPSTTACLSIRHGFFRPKDKGKVERDVQTVRQAVRKTILLNERSRTRRKLNRLMKQWALHDYGEKPHGTTHEKPFVVFTERERPALKALPQERFEVAEWKEASVHPDHYIQFKGKAYSIPHAYVGKKVWIRATEHLLQAFFREQLANSTLSPKATAIRFSPTSRRTSVPCWIQALPIGCCWNGPNRSDLISTPSSADSWKCMP